MLLSASSPVLSMAQVYFLASLGEGIRYTAPSSPLIHMPTSADEKCLNLKFMALDATSWSTLILFPVCCISRIELMSVHPGSLCQVT